MSRLVIIDGHAVAHRAYHSIPKLTFNGQAINAIYGFYSMLLSAIDQLNPDYLLVCLDSPGLTFRTTEFVGYRAKRKPAESDLVSQLPLLPETLTQSSIPFFALGGFEADDLIATISKQTDSVNEVLIITGDKDLMQLVDERTKLFMPIRGLSDTKTFGINEVKEKLGVLPSQVVDLKALMGDMSDNYPGVAGIGPKVAVELLEKYKDLDNIYNHLEDIKLPVREKLIKDRDNAYLSKKLASLIYNIPLEFNMESARLDKHMLNNLLNLFKDYHFKSLVSRLEKKMNAKLGQIKKYDPKTQPSLF